MILCPSPALSCLSGTSMRLQNEKSSPSQLWFTRKCLRLWIKLFDRLSIWRRGSGNCLWRCREWRSRKGCVDLGCPWWRYNRGVVGMIVSLRVGRVAFDQFWQGHVRCFRGGNPSSGWLIWGCFWFRGWFFLGLCRTSFGGMGRGVVGSWGLLLWWGGFGW
jgi:hypothetical protein